MNLGTQDSNDHIDKLIESQDNHMKNKTKERAYSQGKLSLFSSGSLGGRAVDYSLVTGRHQHDSYILKIEHLYYVTYGNTLKINMAIYITNCNEITHGF